MRLLPEIEVRVFAPSLAPNRPRKRTLIESWNENELGQQIVDDEFQVHTTLGPGLLESVYEVALLHELPKRGSHGLRQVPMRVQYDDIVFDQGCRA